jgi:sigma-54 dependent transcriptional regulator, gfr operon transcriptional activator
LQARITSLITSALQLGPTTDTLFKKLSDSLNNGDSITEQNFLLAKVLNQVDTIASEKLLSVFAQAIQKDAKTYITHVYGVTFPSDNISGKMWHLPSHSRVFVATTCQTHNQH